MTFDDEEWAALSDQMSRDGADSPGTGGHAPERAPADPLGVTAIVVGCIGLVVFGIVLALVTALLAGVAGQRAKEHGRDLSNAYLGLGLAALDGIVWLVLHFAFKLRFVAG